MSNGMSRRNFMGTSVAAIAASTMLPVELDAATLAEKPNFVVFMADDLGARSVGCYDMPSYAVNTPNIDALADAGVKYETAWATPVCTPTRAEIITGRYGFRTGWTYLPGETYYGGILPEKMHIEKHHLSFANVLKCEGYTTAIGGKWMLAGVDQEMDQQLASLGFDEHCMWGITEDYMPTNSGYTGPGGKTSRYWNPALIKNGKYWPATEDDYGPDMLNDFFIDFIDRNKDGEKPFCAYYAAMLPHTPSEDTPDPNNPGGRLTGSIANSMEYMDHLIGKLVKSLDDRGLRDNTIIMICGDNGTEGMGKKSWNREAGPRVPFIANCPARIQSGVVTRELMDFSDILPTLADFAGATKHIEGYKLDGISIKPVLTDPNGKGRDWIYAHMAWEADSLEGRQIRDDRWIYDGNGDLYDCGVLRSEVGYTLVTAERLATDPEAAAILKKFNDIYADMDAEALITLPDPPKCVGSAVKTSKAATLNKNLLSVQIGIGGYVHFRIPKSGRYRLEVVDVKGKLISSTNSFSKSGFTIKIKTAGVYFARLKGANGISHSRSFVITD